MKLISYYNLTACCALVLIGGIAQAQQERSKSFSEAWSDITDVVVEHRHGPLEIIPHTSGDVKLEATIKVRANEAVDAQAVIDHFEIDMDAFGQKLDLSSKFNTKSWHSNNNNTRVKFEDGTKATGIKDIEIKYQLFVPNLESLEISNRYNDIEIAGNYSGDVKIKQYDADVRTRNINGKLELNVKYGRADIAEVGNSDITLYDAKMELASADELTVTSKYSSYKIAQSTALEMDTYDDKIELGSISGTLKIDDKYSDFVVTSATDVDISIYDGTFTIETTGPIKGSSKYSSFKVGRAESLDLNSSHDDDFEIGAIGSISCHDSKYTEYKVESLSKGISLKSYDDNLTVNDVGSTFENFDIDCKYADVRLPLDAVPGYTITANMKYGNLRYPEPTNNIRHKEDNDQLELQAHVGADGAQAKVNIKAYDSRIRLER